AKTGSGGPRSITGHLVNQGLVKNAAESGYFLMQGIYEVDGGVMEGLVAVDHTGEVRITKAPPNPTTVPMWGETRLTTDNLPGVELWVQGGGNGGGAALTISSNKVNRGIVRLESVGSNWASLLVAPGGFTNASTGKLVSAVGTSGPRFVQGAINNFGVIECWLPTSLGSSNANHLNGGTIRLLDAARVEWVGNSMLNDSAGLIEGGGTLAIGEVSFENRGTLAVAGTLGIEGTLLQTAGNVRLNQGALVANRPIQLIGGTLVGPGTVRADLVTGADLFPGQPPGSLVLTGNLRELPSAHTRFGLGGLTPEVDFVPFKISGSAQFLGKQSLTLAGGFVPAVGDRFTVMTFGSRGASTGCLVGRRIADGVLFDPEWNPQNLTLVARMAHVGEEPLISFQFCGEAAVHLLLEALPELTYKIEASPDLQEWTVIDSQSSDDGIIEYTDPEGSAHPQRFYRAVAR
ncbi:MAG TPA: hypothetical protein PLX89_03245, partial [Verrucomicrobiota bacterium]|nr:hypothetical protein [Verrucomicrobiota bacterium]